uniref:Prepilin-type N-terminal cleavage/methylation domain-containing protein n=1 Tax=Candidatus Kentrum sp. FM TaxID=2126340 RepID=A0A450VRQ7_9GAMM|nr:MAG: prepilin-type N-terminal cleavage/methylation domain-containing protein [Candidatus Kentron sp. FM]VFJ62681.1 MAG: prepilin-type N-terminal cleavage/methylation domain-containing protein [Candidatus Kentron sp. FM]VFK07473.1 MAG: prepilin-type N-terminal cleavage/methylation domain-containing protein [Candidatus Kentron sp. FM]
MQNRKNAAVPVRRGTLPHTGVKSTGFSLVELLIAVIVLGVLASIIASHFSILISLQRQDYSNEQRLLNQEIGMALLGFARYHTDHGTLPAPYTGGADGFFNTVCSPDCDGVFDIDGDGASDEEDEERIQALKQELRRSGINQRAINHDDRGLPRIRVYQKATGEAADIGAIAVDTPLFGRHGPQVTLHYDFGVVYTTDCPVGDDTCLETISNVTLPGDSELMVASTGDSTQNTSVFSDWQAQGDDIAPFFVSTLPLQKRMLRITAERLNRIRDRLTEYHVSAQLAAQADTTENLYPAPSSPPDPDTSAAAVSGGDCDDAWYDLSSNEVDVLFLIGLDTNQESEGEEKEYGVTAWGGGIWYCRDYNPQTLDNICNADTGSDPGAVVCRIHHAALRIHRSVSEGGAPDAENSDDNLVLAI